MKGEVPPTQVTVAVTVTPVSVGDGSTVRPGVPNGMPGLLTVITSDALAVPAGDPMLLSVATTQKVVEATRFGVVKAAEVAPMIITPGQIPVYH